MSTCFNIKTSNQNSVSESFSVSVNLVFFKNIISSKVYNGFKHC